MLSECRSEIIQENKKDKAGSRHKQNSNNHARMPRAVQVGTGEPPGSLQKFMVNRIKG